jgi:hypothetical protein
MRLALATHKGSRLCRLSPTQAMVQMGHMKGQAIALAELQKDAQEYHRIDAPGDADDHRLARRQHLMPGDGALNLLEQRVAH